MVDPYLSNVIQSYIDKCANYVKMYEQVSIEKPYLYMMLIQEYQ